MVTICSVFKRIMLTGALLLFAACGGGGGGDTPPVTPSADTMTVTVWSQATGTTTTKYTADGGATTSFGSVVSYPTPTVTSVLINSPTVQVVVSADAVTPGTYPITSNLAVLSVRYTLYQSPTTTIIFGTNANGTIVLSSVGAVNQPITGSFEADVFKSPFPVATYPTDTLHVSGTFSVKRWF